VEFANIEFEGREVPAQELADKLDTSSRTLLSWLGDSNKRKKDLADHYEKYQGVDGKMYIRRKEKQGAPEKWRSLVQSGAGALNQKFTVRRTVRATWIWCSPAQCAKRGAPDLYYV
jgi:uncharacterized protein YjcR